MPDFLLNINNREQPIFRTSILHLLCIVPVHLHSRLFENTNFTAVHSRKAKTKTSSPRNPRAQILIKSRLEMKNENDRPSSSEYPSTVTFFSILHERKTIQPLILHISSAKRTPLCPVALFPSPSPATIPVSGEMSTGGEVAIKLHALYTRGF